jgi:uncharacterized protein (DUF927 family)
MSNPNTNPALDRIRSYTIIHATALREWVNDSPTDSRSAELMEIVRDCERNYLILALFRTMEPMLADFNYAFDAFCAAEDQKITNN